MYTSPGFYQSPYTQPTQNPYMDRLAQMQPPQQPRDGLIRVTGMDGARAYQMPPNSAVALFDGGQDVFYVKTTDGAGFPTIRAYSFQPMEQAQAMGANSALPLGSIIRRFGCAVDLNGTGVNLSEQGYYAVDGSITYTPTDAGMITVQLMADGVAVPGASASVTAVAATTYNLSIVGMVRRCCSTPGTLTLMVNLAGTVNNIGLIVGKVA